jgi:hypothetical protein
MKMIIVWLLSVNVPLSDDYIYYTNFFNSEAECLSVATKVTVEKPIELKCVSSAVWVPMK